MGETKPQQPSKPSQPGTKPGERALPKPEPIKRPSTRIAQAESVDQKPG